ncbi:MAG TPA: segregation/condensation protein A [Candidatus Nanoarchaeia archaeon]|nr:segregation/condensation protein A [Candidatus Nanoarchaeia archaeon]
MINVKLEKFEGPLSLLLKIIEAEKMDIAEISLAKIADQYVEFIRTTDDIDPEAMADFLVVAAKLLYLKSRALLPYLFPAEESDQDDLERQLKMYREFLEAMKKLESRLKEKRFMFAPTERKLWKMIGAEEKFFAPPKKLRAEDLAACFRELLVNKKIVSLEEETIRHKVNIEEKIQGIRDALLTQLNLSFREFLAKAESKTEVIVSFLAVLELMKQKTISVEQGELFAEILISRKQNIV